jgi:DNA-binding NarL/FixJ family response regulator
LNQVARSTSSFQNKASVLVVDGHPIFREGVTQLINRQPDMIVCGEAGDVEIAKQVLESRRPRLVLLDLRLGTSDVFELIKGWKCRFPRLRVLILSAYEETLYAERALRAGADGYVMKDEASDETIRAIRAVLAGEMYVSRKMAAGLLHKLIQRKSAARDASVEALSDRELHVFRMLGAGLSSRKIGDDLQLSIKTIETYRENIKHKLGLRNATELIRQATQWVQNSAPQQENPLVTPEFNGERNGEAPHS